MSPRGTPDANTPHCNARGEALQTPTPSTAMRAAHPIGRLVGSQQRLEVVAAEVSGRAPVDALGKHLEQPDRHVAVHVAEPLEEEPACCVNTWGERSGGGGDRGDTPGHDYEADNKQKPPSLVSPLDETRQANSDACS